MHRWLVPLLALCAPLLAQDGDDAAFSISGQVVTEGGRPCEGAQVQLWDALASDRALARAVADKDGQFELSVTLGAIARREHPFGPVRVEASKLGRARVGGRVAPGANKLRIVLPKPAAWTGVLHDPNGDALPGAPVRAEQGELRFATTTDENGAYEFADMGDGRMDLGQPTVEVHPTVIYLRAEGHVERRIAAAAGEPVELKLERAPVGEGRIVDHDSRSPLAGVRLVALDGSSPVEAVTDADGKFAIEVEQRVGRVAAYRDGYAMTVLQVDTTRTGQEFELATAAAVSGTVVDEEGSPLAFATVHLDPGFGHPIPERCDEAGVFHYSMGVPEFARVTAERRGYLPGHATVDATWRADRVRVELARGREVTGIVNRGGSPVLGAEVVFRGVVAPGVGHEFGRAYTDATGAYRARAIPPEATHVFARWAGERSALAPIDDRVDLKLADRLALEGRVLDDEGTPVVGATLSPEGIADITATTDSEGRFRSGEVPVGRWPVNVTVPEGYVAAPQSIVAGEPAGIVVQRKRGDKTLTVKCGARRSGYTEVVLRSGKLVRRRWLAAESDTVEFANLGPGACTVSIDAVGYIPYAHDVEAPATLSAELERAGTLILAATPGARLVVQTLEGQPSPVISRRLDEERVAIGGFGPGRYRLIARAADENIVIREVSVGPKDAPREIDLAGGPASTLEILVRGADGSPLEGASIEFVTEGGFTFRTSERTNAEGRVTIARLILGPVRVVARSGEDRADKGIEIEAGAKHSITIEMR